MFVILGLFQCFLNFLVRNKDTLTDFRSRNAVKREVNSLHEAALHRSYRGLSVRGVPGLQLPPDPQTSQRGA